MRRLAIIALAIWSTLARAEESVYTVNASVRSVVATNAAEWIIVADLVAPSVETGSVHAGYGLICESSYRDGDQFAIAEVYTQTVGYLEARLTYVAAPGATNTAPRVGAPTPGLAIVFEAVGTNSVPFPGLPGVGAASDWLRWTTLNSALRRLIAAIAAGGSGSTNGVEVDPRWSAVSNSVQAGVSNGNLAASWGDHRTFGYVTSSVSGGNDARIISTWSGSTNRLFITDGSVWTNLLITSWRY